MQLNHCPIERFEKRIITESCRAVDRLGIDRGV